MGRSLSISPVKLAVWKESQYIARPVWEFVSTAIASPNAYRSVYGANDPVNYLEALSVGAASGVRSRSALRNSDENAQNYYIAGITTAPGATSGFNPAGGLWGITGFSETGSLNHWYSNEAGEFGYTYGNAVFDTLARSVHVTPTAEKNRNYEMVLNNQFLRVGPIGGAWAPFFSDTTGTISSLNRAFDITAKAVTGFEQGSFGLTNFGMASYNANSGLFIAMYGMDDASKSYRVHVFPIGKDVLHKDTTFAEMEALFAAAKAGYRYFDLTLTNMTYSYSSAPSDHKQHRLIACDDGTMWICANDKANSSYLYLRTFKVSQDVRTIPSASVLVLNTHYSPVNSVASASTHYGVNQGSNYATKFMLSDDNKYTAVYSHYYYYCPGAMVHFLPNTSVNDRYVMASYAETTYGRSIAPIGGSKFVMNMTANADGATTNMSFIDPASTAVAVGYTHTNFSSVTGQYLMYSATTNYNSCFVNKVMPLSLFK